MKQLFLHHIINFNIQPEMANRLGYNDRGGLKNVERFMKHYFLTAKEVGDLTRIICSVLEERQKNKNSLISFMRNFFDVPGRYVYSGGGLGFYITKGRLKHVRGKKLISLKKAMEKSIT